MDFLKQQGIKAFNSGITLFPDWAAYVIGQCRENGYDQKKALPTLKQLYAQILANPAVYGVPSSFIQRESTLADVRRFNLDELPQVDTGFYLEMLNLLLTACFDKCLPQRLTIQQAQEYLLYNLDAEFHTEIYGCIKSLYTALKYHPGAQRFFVSSIQKVDVFNPYAPHHFTDEDKRILLWVGSLLGRIQHLEAYESLGDGFIDYCKLFRAQVSYLLDGSLESEAGFRLSVTDKNGHENYYLSVTLNPGGFEFNLYADGSNNCNERYSESVLYWYVNEDGIENDDSAKQVLLEEYEYWFINMQPGIKIEASIFIGDMDEFEVSTIVKKPNFPKSDYSQTDW
ncbi:hypothetical protein JAO78_012605 [Alishewanella sp. 16-MA]|uniref:Uncharacterized protein n=1 Tax=Alishewanella maricola TaxID=2795740 RepID=A0ABS8C694_9ALTE|nr:hypothetical protein [Alishewanella maricola]MCB5227653.1 hypothetical protein [Alishewanella maricola]